MRLDTTPYSLHRRDGIFYVQFRNQESRKWTTPKSTGTKDRNTALLTVSEWMRDGIPQDKTDTLRRPLPDLFHAAAIIDAICKALLTPEEARKIVDILKERKLVDVSAVKRGPGDQDLISFLVQFWDFGASPYIADRIAHGQRIGRRHCDDMSSCISVHWKPAFQDRSLSSITKNDIRDFSVVVAGKGLAAATVNKILIAGTAALTWAKENDLIPTDPGEGLRKFSGAPKIRGVLEPDEVAELFKREYWPDERTYLANLTAALTGMRQGEILALKVCDLKTDRIVVSHSWSNADGLKETKTGIIRQVPLLPALHRALLDLAASNPWGPASYFFYGGKADRPLDGKPLLDDLRAAFIMMRTKGSDNPNAEADAADEWKVRNLCFHGWRHYFSSRMADSIDLRKLSTATGHRSMEVLESYANHSKKEDFTDLGKAVASLFAGVPMPERTRSKVV